LVPFLSSLNIHTELRNNLTNKKLYIMWKDYQDKNQALVTPIELLTEDDSEIENASLVFVLFQSLVFFIVAVVNTFLIFCIQFFKNIFFSKKCKKGNTKEALQEIQIASNYIEWERAAKKLDTALGRDTWKMNPESILYDNKLIEHRLQNLKKLSLSGEYHSLLLAIREVMVRNLGGIENKALYEYCTTGTKQLIVDYINEVVRQLHFISSLNIDGFTLPKKIRFFYELRQSYGRSALLLSGGASMGS